MTTDHLLLLFAVLGVTAYLFLPPRLARLGEIVLLATALTALFRLGGIG